MDVRVRCCSLTKPASDGSIIGKTVVQNYLESEEYRLSIDGKLTLGYLTHRGRSLDTISPNITSNPGALKKCIGKDDMGLLLGSGTTFTHYVKEFYIEDVPGEGPWLCALVHILDEDGFDEEAANNIKRLKALIRNGIRLTCSLVVIAYWDTQSNGIDNCLSIKNLRSLDFTQNPSFGPLARITEVIDDEKVKEDITKTFSDLYEDKVFIKSQPKEGELKAKTFSDISSFSLGDVPKSSKINGCYTKLKVKEFSSVGEITLEDIINPFNNKKTIEPELKQKEFTMAQVKERLREYKLGPRMYMRRLYISYKQMVKTLGGIEKIEEEDLKILKSLFTSDVLNILNSITPEIMKGKQINTLLGLSSLSKTARVEGQKLQMPLRQAHIEFSKQGYISKMRMQKLQTAYTDFIKGLYSDVFGNNPEPIPDEENSED